MREELCVQCYFRLLKLRRERKYNLARGLWNPFIGLGPTQSSKSYLKWHFLWLAFSGPSPVPFCPYTPLAMFLVLPRAPIGSHHFPSWLRIITDLLPVFPTSALLLCMRHREDSQKQFVTSWGEIIVDFVVSTHPPPQQWQSRQNDFCGPEQILGTRPSTKVLSSSL